jgi:hypothetical protein
MKCKKCNNEGEFYKGRMVCKKCIQRYQHEWVISHKKQSLELGRRYNAIRRQKVLDAYGRKCACCGETEEQFLTLEHKRGDGNKDRREHGTGYMYQIALKKINKDKYEILCYNCNNARGRYGQCPHVKNIIQIGQETQT